MPDIFLVLGEQVGYDELDVEAGIRFERGIPAVSDAAAEIEELLSNSVYDTAYERDNIEDFVRGVNYLLNDVEEVQ